MKFNPRNVSQYNTLLIKVDINFRVKFRLPKVHAFFKIVNEGF